VLLGEGFSSISEPNPDCQQGHNLTCVTWWGILIYFRT